MVTEERRFSSALEGGGIGGVLVTDSAGQKLAYVYFEDEPGRRIRPGSTGFLARP